MSEKNINGEDILSDAKNDEESGSKEMDMTCPICFSVLFDKYSRDRHVQFAHSSDKKEKKRADRLKPYLECSDCDKVFRNKGSLKRHKIQHEAHSKTFPCDHCDKKFTRKDSLSTHYKIVHKMFEIDFTAMERSSSADGDYFCKICEACFGPNLRKFEAHMYLKVCQNKVKQEVNDSHKFQCEMCEKSYFERKCLYRHINLKHKTPRDFKCEICDVSYSYKSSLTRHVQKVH